MLRRLAILAFIVHQFCWLNMVLPGHTRGRITVAADEACGSMHANCCAARAHPTDQSDHSSKPTPADRAHCAVCFVTLGTCADHVPVWAPAPLGLLERIDAPAPSAAPVVQLVATYDGRAPPGLA